MKRLVGRRKAAFVRLTRKRWAKIVERRRRAASLRELGLTYFNTPLPTRSTDDRNQRTHVVAPLELTLHTTSSTQQVIRFLDRARSLALAQGRRILLDLRPCRKLGAEVVLLLVAEYSRIRFLMGNDAISGASPVDPEARAMLHAMGFFQAANLKDTIPFEGAPFFKVETGIRLDGEVPKSIAREFGEGLRLDAERVRGVQTALTEALENISEHAYLQADKLRYPAELGRWWIGSASFPDHRAAYLVACDLGVTIQETIHETAERYGRSNLAALRDFLSAEGRQNRSERLLAAAFQDGVTRRPDGRGGRGLGKMARLLQEFDAGHMNVWSGEACATLGKSNEGVVTTRLPCTLPGTYVVWMVKQEAK